MTNRVLYDLQVFVEQSRGGVSRYFLELSRSLDGRGAWLPMVPPGLHMVPRDVDLPWTGLLWRAPQMRRGFRALRRANEVIAKASMRSLRRQASVFHPTWYHRSSIEVWGDGPLALTIHDLIPEAWPQVTTPEQLADRAWAIRRADVILCVSEATRQDLLERFPEVANRTFVSHPGLSHLATPVTAVPSAEPYFVYVGKRGSYKDFATLLRALQATNHRLVAIGGGSPSPSLLQQLDAANIGDRVEFRTAPDDAEMAKILQGAKALISTSRQEGFGIPPMEALWLGTPVILSDIAVYREVYGPWATFFDPADDESLADAMTRVVEHRPPVPSRDELAGRYSWDKTAATTEEAYQQAVS